MKIDANQLPLFWRCFPCPAHDYAQGIAIALKQLNLEAKASVPIEPGLGFYRSPVLLSYRDQSTEALAEQINQIVHQHIVSTLCTRPLNPPSLGAFEDSPKLPHMNSQNPPSLGDRGAHSGIDETCQISSQQPFGAQPEDLFQLDVTPQGWLTMETLMPWQIDCINQLGARSPLALFPPCDTQIPEADDPPFASDLQWELAYAHARCTRLLNLVSEHYSLVLPLSLAPALKDWLSAKFMHPGDLSAIEAELWGDLLNFSLQIQKNRIAIAPFTGSLADLNISSKTLQQVALRWLKMFQNFYSLCPLFHFSDPRNQPQLQLRIALLAGLQKVLSFLWTGLFRHRAPESL